MRTRTRALLALSFALGFHTGEPFAAQTPEVLLVEGDPLPGFPGSTVLSLQSPTVNAVGGWSIVLTVDDGFDVLGMAWGNPAGGDGAILFDERTIGDFDQVSWEFSSGLSDAGEVGYSATATMLSSGVAGLDTLWVDELSIAIEGEPIPSLPGKIWRFASRPSLTSGGEPLWIGGIEDAFSGADEGTGLFRGAAAQVVLQAGDVLPGLPAPIMAGSSLDLDYRFSPDGSHYILAVDADTGTSVNDLHVVLDGAALTIDGLIVAEFGFLPVALQVLANESWDNFDFFGVSDDGSYLVTGDTAGSPDTDEFILIDGQILFRESDVVDGRILEDNVSMAVLSAREDLAFVMETDDGTTDEPEALFFNGRVILEQGQAIDLDGDGQIDANAVIRDFTGTNALAVTTERVVYVTADVDTAGTTTTGDDVEVLFRIPVPDLSSDVDQISIASGGTASYELFTPRDAICDVYLLLGSESGTSPGVSFGGILLPLNPDDYTTFTVTGANSPFLPGSAGIPGLLGTANAALNLPLGLNPALAGKTLSHAFVCLELATLTVTSASNAVDVLLVP